MARKLGMPTELRMSVLKNQVSNLLWYGKIETTVEAAKEIRSIAEKLITVAINSYENTIEVTKKGKGKDKKGNETEIEIKSINDGPIKLNARRKLMRSLNDLQEIKGRKENRTEYRERTKDVNHPLIEKMFNEIAPKYAARAKELGQGGGYTRILRLGARRGDSAEMAIIELV